MMTLRATLLIAVWCWAGSAAACGKGWGFTDRGGLEVAFKNWAMTPRPTVGPSPWKSGFPFRFVRDPAGDYLIREQDGWHRPAGERLVDIRAGRVFVRGTAVGAAKGATVTLKSATYAVDVRKLAPEAASDGFPRYALRLTRDGAAIVDQTITTHGCAHAEHDVASLTRWLTLYVVWREHLRPKTGHPPAQSP